MIIDGNKLRPSEGYKYISNGEVWSDEVWLGIHDSPDNWHDTNDEPPSTEEATAEDYDTELRRLGVDV